MPEKDYVQILNNPIYRRYVGIRNHIEDTISMIHAIPNNNLVGGPVRDGLLVYLVQSRTSANMILQQMRGEI